MTYHQTQFHLGTSTHFCLQCCILHHNSCTLLMFIILQKMSSKLSSMISLCLSLRHLTSSPPEEFYTFWWASLATLSKLSRFSLLLSSQVTCQKSHLKSIIKTLRPTTYYYARWGLPSALLWKRSKNASVLFKENDLLFIRGHFPIDRYTTSVFNFIRWLTGLT